MLAVVSLSPRLACGHGWRQADQTLRVYTLLYLPASIIGALLLALAIEGTGKLRTLFRTIYFLRVITSVIATVLIWKWLYQPQLGLFNQLLESVGLPRQRFLQSSVQALPSIVLYALWKDVGFQSCNHAFCAPTGNTNAHSDVLTVPISCA